MNKPNGKCYCCSGQEWWWRPSAGSGDWLCAQCHPNPDRDNYVEPAHLRPAIAVGQSEVSSWASKKAAEAVPALAEPETKIDFFKKAKELKPDIDPETEALRKRIAAGVEKLATAWQKIVEDKEALSFEDFTERTGAFTEALHKLEDLNSTLMARGYDNCLFIENGKRTKECNSWPNKGTCYVCPCSAEFWDKVICGRGGNYKIKPDPELIKKGEEVIKFLQALGQEI